MPVGEENLLASVAGAGSYAGSVLPVNFFFGSSCFSGSTHPREASGVGGIRTLDRILSYTRLAGERLQPLGHHS